MSDESPRARRVALPSPNAYHGGTLGLAGKEPIFSGGMKLDLRWMPYKDGILQAKAAAGCSFDPRFVDGRRQHIARYPNDGSGITKTRPTRAEPPTGP